MEGNSGLDKRRIFLSYFWETYCTIFPAWNDGNEANIWDLRLPREEGPRKRPAGGNERVRKTIGFSKVLRINLPRNRYTEMCLAASLEGGDCIL